MHIRAFITALGLNAIPALGWFIGEWSAGTMLVLYWLETLIGILLVGIRILLHRRIRPSKGHWDYKAPQGQGTQPSKRSTYLSSFLFVGLLFTAAHGIFLAALGGMLVANHRLTPEVRIVPHDLIAGLLGILVFQLIDFLY